MVRFAQLGWMWLERLAVGDDDGLVAVQGLKKQLFFRPRGTRGQAGEGEAEGQSGQGIVAKMKSHVP
jgi:hypothetical protein